MRGAILSLAAEEIQRCLWMERRWAMPGPPGGELQWGLCSWMPGAAAPPDPGPGSLLPAAATSLTCAASRQAACVSGCIPVPWLCDGEQQCPDSTDEQCGEWHSSGVMGWPGELCCTSIKGPSCSGEWWGGTVQRHLRLCWLCLCSLLRGRMCSRDP